MSKAQPLDLLTLPLRGERLIEASAGTGKTFTIAALYLRLLLGLGGESGFGRPLAVEEILVVTFTEAATEELKGRIRDNIHRLRLACLRAESEVPVLQALLAQITDLPMAAELLLAAERQMDEAAIYTIHGFCQRMLNQNAFESGVLFSQKLVQDETPLRRQACADFWRRHCYPLPLDIARVISKEWSGPHALLSELTPYLQGEMPLLVQDCQEESLEQRHQQIIERIEQVKKAWQQAADQLEALISASDVNKKSYSKGNLPKWLQQVSDWAQQATEEYSLPKNLYRFAQRELHEKSLSGQGPEHPLFSLIEQLCATPLSIRELLLARALREIRYSVQQQKQQRAELGFDDLLSRLDSALASEGGEGLAQLIRQRYPLVMIDEFQDTDPQQYRIFHTIYFAREDCGLLLIGDPKQAIYAFRGADIFTYIQARQQIQAHYTMETNWRSSPAMVQAVNRLFMRHGNPFIFAGIPFQPVKAAASNQSLVFEYREQPVRPMRFWLHQGQGVGVTEYQLVMARQCAAQICDWLDAGQRGDAWLHNADGRDPLQAADITVLVRNRNEATIMQDALAALSIPSVYLSNRDTVFAMPEAQELLRLMQAVLAPEQERTLRTALGSRLFALDAVTLYQLNQDEKAWEAQVAEFTSYRKHWLQRGILPMIREVLARRQLAENILATAGGERRITDLLHLGELLQEASLTLESEHALVRWLAQQITSPDNAGENQQLRLESERHLVQIVTVHKSKGLDYPIVCLPFICGFRRQRQALYHDRVHLKAMLDLTYGDEGVRLAEQERLAEDLRLLYVALTRSVYHCSIGIAPLISGNRKKEGLTDLHYGALGYLLQQGQAADAEQLGHYLAEVSDESIEITPVLEKDGTVWQALQQTETELAARHFRGELGDRWRVTSYSALLQQSSYPLLELLPRLDLEAVPETTETEEPAPSLTIHTFPKGAAAGTFLHGLLESLDFTQVPDMSLLRQQLLQQGLDEIWVPVLHNWLQMILSVPLHPESFSLSSLPVAEKQVEMQFYLPIDSLLQAERLDKLVREHDPLSAHKPPLNFQQVTGMLKGFIDLLFRWQGRYYLLDYKSNWLGSSEEAYTRSALEQAMCEHHYDLQYQIYTLALHRLLRQRLVDYDYQRHFGGVFYLFLRGLSPEKSGQGIFYCRPSLALVQGLDQLFSGEDSLC